MALEAALRILGEFRRPGLGDVDYPRLRARILSAVDRDDFDGYEAIARINGVASPDLGACLPSVCNLLNTYHRLNRKVEDNDHEWTRAQPER